MRKRTEYEFLVLLESGEKIPYTIKAAITETAAWNLVREKFDDAEWIVLMMVTYP